MQRREFITVLGGAIAAWPLAARAQQPALSAIGFVNSATAACYVPFAAAFRERLTEAVNAWRAASATTHQITEAFPWDTAPKYLIRDNDRAFGAVFRARVRAIGIRDRPLQSWKTFLRNHMEGIASIDLFVVPTIAFQQLFAFLVLGHKRRQLLWFAVTRNPTAEWLARQITEAFPWDTAPKYLIRDND